MARQSTRMSVMLATLTVGILLLVVQLSAQESTDTPVAPATPPPVAAEQPQEIKDAVAKFRQRDVAGALKLIEEAVKKDPDLPPARIIMAQLFGQAKQAGAVRSSLERAVMEAPADPEAYVILGDYALRERRVTEAGLLYGKASDLIEKFTGSAKRKKLLEPRVLAGLAATAEARGNWPEAQKQIEAWLKIDPESAAAMQRLARALFKQSDPKKAYDMLKAAAKADPKVLTPSAVLATFYEQAGDHTNAAKWMKYAVETAAPKDLRTHLVATKWALETGQIDEAKKLAGESTELDPKSVDANVLRGVVNLFLGDYKSAEGYFQAAHMQAPDSFAVTNNLALAMVEQNSESKNHTALAYAAENVREYPRLGEALSTYGWVLYKMGKLDDADSALQRAMSLGNPSPDTMYYFARVLVDRDRKKDAKTLLGLALRGKKPFSKRAAAKKLEATLPSE